MSGGPSTGVLRFVVFWILQVTLYCSGRLLDNPTAQLRNGFTLKLASDEIHAVHDEMYRLRCQGQALARLTADVSALRLNVQWLRATVAVLAALLLLAQLALVGLGGSGTIKQEWLQYKVVVVQYR